MNVVHWIIGRLKEPSTYAGLSVVALTLGLTAPEWTAISAAVAALAGVAAVFLPE